MPEVDLNFLARQNERIIQDLASVRDELRVQGAMIMRLEGSVASLSEQVQVVHNQIGRINDRLRKLEDAQA
jgi:septal ring factor EnvC (AmiA/AmiB activator)